MLDEAVEAGAIMKYDIGTNEARNRRRITVTLVNGESWVCTVNEALSMAQAALAAMEAR